MRLLYITKNLSDASTLSDMNDPKSDWLHGRSHVQSDSDTSKTQQNMSLPFTGNHAFREAIANILKTFDDDMINQQQSTKTEMLFDSLPSSSSSDQGAINQQQSAESLKERIQRTLDSYMVLKMPDGRMTTTFEPVWVQSTIPISPKIGFLSDREMLANMLRKLFHDANDEVFEDGMTSNFSDKLHDIILKYDIAAIDQIWKIIHVADDTPVEVVEEALRQIGYINDTKTHSARLSLLERALESPDLYIRDAASIGIEAMEDPRSIPNLKRAIKNESSEWLRQYLKDIITQLEMPNEVPEDR